MFMRIPILRVDMYPMAKVREGNAGNFVLILWHIDFGCHNLAPFKHADRYPSVMKPTKHIGLWRRYREGHRHVITPDGCDMAPVFALRQTATPTALRVMAIP